MSGIAGASPQTAAVGTPAWAHWVINGDVAYEIDPRELPGNWRFARFELGCGAAAWRGQQMMTGTESYELDAAAVPTVTEPHEARR